MEIKNEYLQETTEKQGSVFLGLLGSLLAAVLGAAFWAAAGILTDKVFWYLAVLIGALVALAYDLFKGRKCWQRAAIIIICTVLAVIVGDVVYFGWNLNAEYTELTSLLNTGTNDEIAQYFFSEDTYTQYQALSALDKLYNIRLIKDEFANLSLVEFFETYYLTDTEVMKAFFSDLAMSVIAALVGSIALIVSKNKKDQAAEAVNFDEASDTESAADADDQASAVQ